MTSLQLNYTAMAGVVESWDALVGELNGRMAVFEEEIFILREESNLTAICLYVDQLDERLYSFAVTRRNITAREERCADSKL